MTLGKFRVAAAVNARDGVLRAMRYHLSPA